MPRRTTRRATRWPRWWPTSSARTRRTGRSSRARCPRLSMSTSRRRSTPGRESRAARSSSRASMLPPHHGGVTLQQLVTGEVHRAAAPVGAVAASTSPTGPARRWPACGSRVLLVTDGPGSYVVMVIGPSEQDRGLAVEIAGLDGRRGAGGARPPGELRAGSTCTADTCSTWRSHPMARRHRSSSATSPHDRTRRTSSCPRRCLAGRAPRARCRRTPRRAAGGRPAPQARPAAVRAAGHRQDAHDPLPGRPDGAATPGCC